MKYFVYMLRCRDDTLYTGYTNDVKRRENVHNTGKGAKYTKSRLPVKLVYFEEHESKSLAMKRECEIKKLTRPQKEALIAERSIHEPDLHE
ncbi:MAG: GIY-YIG nuclease family protein [Oscillospiraceae bacterium]|nr:GIY-YIG nuclease family protein [Oscillospiraceae bacterium]